MRIPKTRRAVTLVGLAGIATLMSSALPASATTDSVANCDVGWTAWDPDQGSGAGYSYCWTPYMAKYHRVHLSCYYGGDAYGSWARGWEESFTTCIDGSGASYGNVEVRRS
jgi:hypothetical protein